MIAIEVKKEIKTGTRSIVKTGRLEFDDQKDISVNIHQTVVQILRGFKNDELQANVIDDHNQG